MADFLQLHLLTAYGPSNLNRDDTGRPKSVDFGGVPRLRISSQSLKRAWRTSEAFESNLNGYLGRRTRRIGKIIYDYLIHKKMSEEKAMEIARKIAGFFGKNENKKDPASIEQTFIKQLAFVSPEEEKNAFSFADEALELEKLGKLDEALKESKKDKKGKKGKKGKFEELKVLNRQDTAADIAMFGRMFAATPEFNREAAVQVAHAITTHRAIPEDDYYTAMADLTSDEAEDAGAVFIGVQEFGTGVFYLYVCIDRDLLLKNLGDDKEVQKVRDAGLKALVGAAATVAPQGKQASFASRSRAIYVLGEKGPMQPRSLAAAFLKPVSGEDHGENSIKALECFRDQQDKVYGKCAEEHYVINCLTSKGTLADLCKFAVS